MRIWTVHPSLLDTKGLTGLWSESLLAKRCLEGTSKGYLNHPQLIRFKATPNPVVFINTYLYFVYFESILRGFNFNEKLISQDMVDVNACHKIECTLGQIMYEWNFLKYKLSKRDPDARAKLDKFDFPFAHPMFHIVEGQVEPWEAMKDFKEENE